MMLAPVTFTSDHIETLYELDIELQEEVGRVTSWYSLRRLLLITLLHVVFYLQTEACPVDEHTAILHQCLDGHCKRCRWLLYLIRGSTTFYY
ncbi:hypothetical protein Zmor_027087 [Zophobas morio]|uniref:Uncharacterized protein n=1 Tax=Zophobas morio TaxID=2755281 RepID=A0AA38LZM4_9CUCU|nr:hypothetical protein Zmor_027087 [Zophobas morio]